MRFAASLAAAALATVAAMPAAAVQTQYVASLSGLAESPPTGSPGTGFATVTVDSVLQSMRVEASFSGLLAGVTASHIHCCAAVPGTGTAGVATVTPTFIGFPSGVTSGTYDHNFDMALAGSFNAAFVTANGGTAAGAFNTLVAGLDGGKAYYNIHSSQFPGGEIRGFLHAVPEPETYALMLAGLGVLGWAARRRG
jgi:hypothetical protein